MVSMRKFTTHSLWNKPIIFLFLLLISFSGTFAQEENSIIPIAVSYCTVECDSRPIMAEYSDQWFLAPADEFNHKLMQISFVMAAAAFRDKTRDLAEMDYNIRTFFDRAEFRDLRTDDYDRQTSISTIGSAIAHKKIGDMTLIAVAVSGNNYQNEWLSNFTVSDEARMKGFNDASEKVLERIREYIRDHELTGDVRLWITGYSRAAAVANITAADVLNSGAFAAVYGYTIATPRTTKDPDADRYGSIFNLIGPFDPVPMIPFPEWGYKRYGIDLYLPAIETDSNYMEKKASADAVSEQITEAPVRFNPQINAALHTVMDYLVYFVSSSNSYKQSVQNALIFLYETRDYKEFLKTALTGLESIPDYTKLQLTEYYYFLDFLSQVAYTSFRGQKFHPDDLYWDPNLSIQENFMHEHYDSAYLAWIFSSDDPGQIYSAKVPEYIHYTVTGEVDVELFDSAGNFVERIDRNGQISTDIRDVRAPGFTGGESKTKVHAQRNGRQTLIILPKDQSFSAKICSDKNQQVRFSYIEYAADRIRADVRYVYTADLIKGSFTEGITGLSETERLSSEDLREQGFLVEEPWSNDVIYSPTAVMRLENSEVFHPAPYTVLTFSFLILIYVIYLIVMCIIGIVKGIRYSRDEIRARKTGGNSADAALPGTGQLQTEEKTKPAAANHAKIEESVRNEAHAGSRDSAPPDPEQIKAEQNTQQDIRQLKDGDHENQ